MSKPIGSARTLVLASNNRGKVAEFAARLEPLQWKLVPQSVLGVGAATEDGLSFVENALLKARHVARATGRPVLADDSGLLVPALDGAPGLRSARYAGSPTDDVANYQRLLEALQDVAQREAFFHCALALLDGPEDAVPLLASASWWGRIAQRPQGKCGFGYDPVFLVDGLDVTAAQLDPVSKNHLSHRGQALDGLLQAMGEDPRWRCQ